MAGLVGKRVHAERQEAAGVDIIVAQGYEAGGHTGEIASMVLMPEVVDAVRRRRCSPPAASATAARSPPRSPSARKACGAARCGSPPRRPRRTRSSRRSSSPRRRATRCGRGRHRQAGPPAAHGVDRRVGGPDNPEPLPMPLHGMLVAEAQLRIQRSAARRLRRREARQLLRRPDRRLDEPVKPATQVVYDMVEEYIDAAERVAATIAE